MKGRIGESIAASKEAVTAFFHRILYWIGAAARQAVRFFLFPTARRRRIHPEKDKAGFVKGLIAWSEQGEPEDPQEKEILFRIRWYRLVTFLWINAILALAILVFGNPIPRAMSSLRYVADSWTYIFRYLFLGQEDIPAPSMANESSSDFGWALNTVESSWFYLQAGIASMTNRHVAAEWLATTMNGLIDIIKFATWIPIAFLLLKLGASWLVSPKESDDGERTKALAFWEDTVVPRFVRPAMETVKDYLSWCSSRSSGIKKAIILLTAATCVYGWTALDFVTSYFAMLMTFTFGWFPSFAASVLVDAANVAVRLGIPGFVVIGAIVAYRGVVNSALKGLREMQANNEEVAASLPVIAAINGHVGAGKTTMVSSIATDAECMFREYYFSVIRKYAAAFPRFDWEKLEDWIRRRCHPGEDNASRLQTRARLKVGLNEAWNAWVENGLQPRLPNGAEAFFGYDPKYGTSYFDGAKMISLIDGIKSYAEAYFMYFPGKKLVTSNYPIAMDELCMGGYFPIYAPASSYLSRGCRKPSGEKSYSTIFNEDFFRIKKAVNEADHSKDASIDGGVIAMTEGSNERGNKNDYVGMSKKDDGANQVNDGWNKAMRLIRHWFMVDGRPCCMYIYDYQRADAMNADQRNAAEDTITILERSEEQIALPGWWFLDYVTSFAEAKWTNYYWYAWRRNRRKRTLLNRFLGSIADYFINLRQRIRYSYGFEVVAFDRVSGGANGLVGQRTTEQYFFIYRKTRGELFNSGVYAPILEQRSIAAKSGWTDMPTFTSIEATPEEFARENSFFMRDISSLFDKKAAGRAATKIRAAAEEGTDLRSEEEEEPQEAPEQGEGG